MIWRYFWGQLCLNITDVQKVNFGWVLGDKLLSGNPKPSWSLYVVLPYYMMHTWKIQLSLSVVRIVEQHSHDIVHFLQKVWNFVHIIYHEEYIWSHHRFDVLCLLQCIICSKIVTFAYKSLILYFAWEDQSEKVCCIARKAIQYSYALNLAYTALLCP